MRYIKRDIEAQLIEKLKQPKALFILDARQVDQDHTAIIPHDHVV